jgi:O-antigen/teichoic acid export membrane protein
MPKKEVDGLKILRFCLVFGLIISLFSLVIIVLLNEPITTSLKFEGYSKYLYLLPLALLFSNSAIIFDQWIVRQKKFKASSVISISQSLLSNGSLIGLGYLAPQFASLIGVNVLSRGYHAIASFFGSGVLSGVRDQKSELEGESSGKKMRDLLKEYRDFPFYRTPQILISTLSYNLPIMLMSGFFGTEAAGYYSLAHRVLKLPSIIISDSVGKVFQQHATETAQKGSSLQPLIMKTTLLLAFIGAVPLGLIILFGPFLFSFVFGAEWYQAGLFARWVAIWVLVTFISVPVVVATPLLELQKQYLIFEVVSLVLSIISLVIGFVMLENSMVAVALFSITNAFLIALFVIFVIIKSKDRNRFQPIESK